MHCQPLIVEGDLGCLFICVNVLEECSVGIVLLLLDGGAKLQQRLWDFLLCGPQNIDQPT